jgi:hypothetical protein
MNPSSSEIHVQNGSDLLCNNIPLVQTPSPYTQTTELFYLTHKFMGYWPLQSHNTY